MRDKLVETAISEEQRASIRGTRSLAEGEDSDIPGAWSNALRIYAIVSRAPAMIPRTPKKIVFTVPSKQEMN